LQIAGSNPARVLLADEPVHKQLLDAFMARHAKGCDEIARKVQEDM
jgi:hypothetical protein